MPRFANLQGKTFLLGIGTQKAGTSWLADYCYEHPEIKFSPIKELHYFDQVHLPDRFGHYADYFKVRARDRWAQAESETHPEKLRALWPVVDRLRMNHNPDAYLEYFDRLASRGPPVIGEITPSYCLLPEDVLAQVREWLLSTGCRLRVVFLMREPCERFWSQLRYLVGLRRIASAREEFDKALDDSLYLERSRYDRILTRLERVFEPAELSCHFYETLFRQKEIDRFCAFLGISPVAAQFGRSIIPSPRAPLLPEQRRALRERFEDVYPAVLRRFGSAVPELWLASPPA